MSRLSHEMSPEDFNLLAQTFLPGHLGIEICTRAEGRIEARMKIAQIHLAPNRFLHAASVVALADTACGYAAVAHLPDGAESFTTIELKSNHLGTLREGYATCVASAQHLGRNTQVWDAEVSDESSGRKIAMFRCTQMILWPK